MRERIIDILRTIEAEYGVRVVYACESGSRAWGFASPDSDYDVRFVYVRPEEDYLSLTPVRDVIEKMYPEENVDLAGWDLRKALVLFSRSNPSFYEWLNSPVLYLEDHALMREVRLLEGPCFNPRASFHHYLGTAVSHDLRNLDRKGITLKKFLYYFRSLLCCEWVLAEGTPPPVRFDELFRAMLPTDDLRERTGEMLRTKSRSKENDGAEVDGALIGYAHALRDRMEEAKGSVEYRAAPPGEELERLFLKAVQKTLPGRGFFFSYDSEGVGSAGVRIGIGNQEARFGATYMGSNPLEDMIEAADQMKSGYCGHYSLRWSSEPGAMRVDMEVRGDVVDMVVRMTGGDYLREEDVVDWKEKVKGGVPVDEFRSVVLAEARRNLLLHGIVGFSRDWSDDRDVFPMAAFLSLMGVESREREDGTCASSLQDELGLLTGLQELNELGR